MAQLDGKVALVTGAASGIGAKCALTLAREGAKVMVTDIDDVGGKALVAEIKASAGEAAYLTQDVRFEDRWIEVVKEIDSQFGRLDILVSNAGIGIGAASVTDMPLADWQRQNAINLDGVFLSCKHSLPLMRRGGGGSIILLSSVAGLRGAPSLVGYCATKGGVRLFSKALALECAAARDGVRVNSVHPGIIDTPIWGKIDTPAPAGRNEPLLGQERGKGVPMGFAGDPQDIADGILFLASDLSRYMTGSELVIDGGLTSGVSWTSA